jgi:hypothetical protein
MFIQLPAYMKILMAWQESVLHINDWTATKDFY